MLVAVLIALLGLAIVAVSARPGDGRAETAIAVPLIAAVAVLLPLAGVAILVGAGVAYATGGAVARRTLCYGRQLRTVSATAGAVVVCSVFAASAFLGAIPAHPELWLVGAVAPGVLADDVRRQPDDRRGAMAIGGVTMLLALAGSGLVLSGSIADVGPSTLVDTSTDGATGLGSLSILATVLFGALAAGTVARWRYGLHVGPLSIPLVAVWSLDSVVVPVTYLLAGVVALVTITALQPRLCLPGRQLSATAGLLGGGIGAVAALAGPVGLSAVLAGALAAEDARLVRRHAGMDLLDALALGSSLYVLTIVSIGLGTATIIGLPTVIIGTGAVLAILGGGLVLARRERDRPSEAQLRRRETRWAP